MRFIYALMLFFSLLAPASAAIPATPVTNYSIGTYSGTVGADVCRDAVLGYYGPSFSSDFSETTCYVMRGVIYDRFILNTSSEYSCPANSTLTGQTCACKSGFVESGSLCVEHVINNQENCKNAALASGSSYGQQRITVRLKSGTSMCIATEGNKPGVGCMVNLLDTALIVQPNGDRYVQGFPRRTNTGADTCPIGTVENEPKTEKDVADAPVACPNGQMGTVNGETKCIKYPAGTTTTTQPVTSTTTTSTGVDGNSPTVSTTSASSECTGGQCTTTTTTTTTNSDGTKTTTVTKETESDGTASDTPLGSVPKLYETKYPDGVSGVWSKQMNAIKTSQVGALMTNIVPQFSNGGTCPTWTVDLHVATWANGGSANFAPPCWIWSALKVFVIVGALVLARALVFGG